MKQPFQPVLFTIKGHNVPINKNESNMIPVPAERPVVRSTEDRKVRIQSVDILRGMAMLIMAIDQAKDFIRVDALLIIRKTLLSQRRYYFLPGG